MESRCDPDIDLKNFFAEFGVSWPTGSSISYVRGLGKLVVLNTEKNHIKLEKVLKQLNVYPYQVEIELQIVSFELEEITKLGPNITTEKLTTLRTNGLGKLIASPRVITQSGQQATTKGVKEYTYPTEFTICCNSATNTGENATLSIPTAEPGSFETREVGVILDVLPETSPDGEMINITLSPEYIEPPVWEEYGAPFIDANGNKQQTHMPQPFFQTYGIQTNVLIEDGETLLIGGGMPSRDGKKMLYMFLTVNLVDIKGKRLK
jgi:type II secretory pathway component GspD/PulD (secretin)